MKHRLATRKTLMGHRCKLKMDIATILRLDLERLA